MYLISLYFDKTTNEKIQKLICHVAQETGEKFMLDNQVPPHVTVSAIETRHEDKVIACLDEVVKKIDTGTIHWVSIGVFLPQVIYIEPLLNEYLNNLTVMIFDKFINLPDTIISPYYRPFNWLPHCTVGKQLTREQMVEAYKVLQNRFTPFKGKITKIGIAKTNPHRDIKIWEIGKGIDS